MHPTILHLLFNILPQPDDTACAPTTHSGNFAIFLACDALRQGARIACTPYPLHGPAECPDRLPASPFPADAHVGIELEINQKHVLRGHVIPFRQPVSHPAPGRIAA